MASLSNGFKAKCEKKLNDAAAGKFFTTNNARLLPSFDRCDEKDTDTDELTLGVKLGEGAFCDVKEITAIVLKRRKDVNVANNTTKKLGASVILPKPNVPSTRPINKRNSTGSDDGVDEADFPTIFQDKNAIREYMLENCMRDTDNDNDNDEKSSGGQAARYALKQLKSTGTQKQLEQGLIDISLEAKFLACLNHSNIIKMRGVAGKPLSPNFGLVLDRLYMTLEDKMDRWTVEYNMTKSGGFCGCFQSVDARENTRLILAAITVAYDLSCALRYIHSNNLIYRDIKPENAGFDVRGNIKLFDFGFCKELTKKLRDRASGLYKLTKQTGSPPYMSPENYLGKPYGYSSDVFSFGVLLWEMLHHRFAFYYYSKPDFKQIVVENGYRPSIDKSLCSSSRVMILIKECWHPDPEKRPSFDRISLSLRTEYQELSSEKGIDDEDDLTRSQRLMRASVRSFRTRRKK